MALRKGTALEYVHADHLGGTVLATDSAGAEKSRIAYLPFAGARTSPGALGTDREFTGQRLDGTGLYFYSARYGACPEAWRRDAGIGGFISADTLIPGICDPPRYNRYSYGVNNPMRYTDPTGYCCWDQLKVLRQ